MYEINGEVSILKLGNAAGHNVTIVVVDQRGFQPPAQFGSFPLKNSGKGAKLY